MLDLAYTKDNHMHTKYNPNNYQNKIILNNPHSSTQSIFRTQRFQELTSFLLNKNSIVLLHNMLSNCYTTYQSMPNYQYIQALHYNFNNLQTSTQFNKYSEIWYQELLYRALHEIIDPKIHKDQIYNIINTIISKINTRKLTQQKIHYLYKKTHNTLKENTIIFTGRLILQGLIKHSQEMLDNLFQYYFINQNNNFCILLMFYGITPDKNYTISLPQCSPSTIILRLHNTTQNINSTMLRSTTISSKNFFNKPLHDNSSELDYQMQIATTIATHITALQYKKKQKELFLEYNRSWYYIILRQFHKLTLRTINISIIELQQIDNIFQESVKYGDCTIFFQNLHNIIKQHSNIFSYNKRLIKEINKIESLYHSISFEDFLEKIAKYKSTDIKYNLNNYKKHKLYSKSYIKKLITDVTNKTSNTITELQTRILKILLTQNTKRIAYNTNSKLHKAKLSNTLQTHTKYSTQVAPIPQKNIPLHSKFYIEKPLHSPDNNITSNAIVANKSTNLHNKSKNKLSSQAQTINPHDIVHKPSDKPQTHSFQSKIMPIQHNTSIYPTNNTPIINKKYKFFHKNKKTQKNKSIFYVETPKNF
ncbi:hypothetical protein HL033_01395 [Neoehrlichia mikurensis]|uniref:Uncharacterized protein n=1 Tax=Neoehrlichia mikurensis TaxID=89586 RepID=A0A9Q9F4E8_9RICK|nr:hypothetical protein [Neoehrlichia mikurensis]QXK92207.1 hypothetical protein IAH97_01390 [Neoehrlichia mikurensis]QXK92663.1 hypothetical protein HUN61_01390 [Neoehrlichia mikurensis]QXK93900.1 hypothetical protein HL033_01395 [Neoehrlichia mikurensis]UTO55101.1 hypothetical protein LUA82_02720 [Neoehrlichia mikurensis]UTO56020.1 hypothetical protein LUA81_02700 [Neoehrlichia mikurensis]